MAAVPALSMATGKKVRLKCRYRQEIRVVVISADMTFQILRKRLSGDFGFDVCLKYTDADGDMITLASQNDLLELFSFADDGSTISVAVGEPMFPDPVRRSTAATPSMLVGPRGGSPAALPATPFSSSGRRFDRFPTLEALVTARNTEEEGIRWKRAEVIGKGAFGTVYLGLNTDTGELMAVKQMDIGEVTPKELATLENEVHTLYGLSHPNIVRYIGTERSPTTLCIFLEYVPGGSIRSLLQKFGKLEEPVLCTYTRQLLMGLEYLHNNGIAHRDIKGANCLVGNDGVIKLADFGASRPWRTHQSQVAADGSSGSGDASSNGHGSSGNDVKGTPMWMAPEVIRETSLTSGWKKADVWSVGCTLIEMATGKPPWSQFSNPVTVMYHIACQEDSFPEFPPDASPELVSFLRGCLQRNPEMRPDASSLLLHAFVGTVPSGVALGIRPSTVGGNRGATPFGGPGTVGDDERASMLESREFSRLNMLNIGRSGTAAATMGPISTPIASMSSRGLGTPLGGPVHEHGRHDATDMHSASESEGPVGHLNAGERSRNHQAVEAGEARGHLGERSDGEESLCSESYSDDLDDENLDVRHTHAGIESTDDSGSDTTQSNQRFRHHPNGVQGEASHDPRDSEDKANHHQHLRYHQQHEHERVGHLMDPDSPQTTVAVAEDRRQSQHLGASNSARGTEDSMDLSDPSQRVIHRADMIVTVKQCGMEPQLSDRMVLEPNVSDLAPTPVGLVRGVGLHATHAHNQSVEHCSAHGVAPSPSLSSLTKEPRMSVRDGEQAGQRLSHTDVLLSGRGTEGSDPDSATLTYARVSQRRPSDRSSIVELSSISGPVSDLDTGRESEDDSLSSSHRHSRASYSNTETPSLDLRMEPGHCTESHYQHVAAAQFGSVQEEEEGEGDQEGDSESEEQHIHGDAVSSASSSSAAAAHQANGESHCPNNARVVAEHRHGAPDLQREAGGPEASVTGFAQSSSNWQSGGPDRGTPLRYSQQRQHKHRGSHQQPALQPFSPLPTAATESRSRAAGAGEHTERREGPPSLGRRVHRKGQESSVLPAPAASPLVASCAKTSARSGGSVGVPLVHAPPQHGCRRELSQQRQQQRARGSHTQANSATAGDSVADDRSLQSQPEQHTEILLSHTGSDMHEVLDGMSMATGSNVLGSVHEAGENVLESSADGGEQSAEVVVMGYQLPSAHQASSQDGDESSLSEVSGIRKRAVVGGTTREHDVLTSNLAEPDDAVGWRERSQRVLLHSGSNPFSGVEDGDPEALGSRPHSDATAAAAPLASTSLDGHGATSATGYVAQHLRRSEHKKRWQQQQQQQQQHQPQQQHSQHVLSLPSPKFNSVQPQQSRGLQDTPPSLQLRLQQLDGAHEHARHPTGATPTDPMEEVGTGGTEESERDGEGADESNKLYTNLRSSTSQELLSARVRPSGASLELDVSAPIVESSVAGASNPATTASLDGMREVRLHQRQLPPPLAEEHLAKADSNAEETGSLGGIITGLKANAVSSGRGSRGSRQGSNSTGSRAVRGPGFAFDDDSVRESLMQQQQQQQQQQEPQRKSQSSADRQHAPLHHQRQQREKRSSGPASAAHDALAFEAPFRQKHTRKTVTKELVKKRQASAPRVRASRAEASSALAGTESQQQQKGGRDRACKERSRSACVLGRQERSPTARWSGEGAIAAAAAAAAAVATGSATSPDGPSASGLMSPMLDRRSGLDIAGALSPPPSLGMHAQHHHPQQQQPSHSQRKGGSGGNSTSGKGLSANLGSIALSPPRVTELPGFAENGAADTGQQQQWAVQGEALTPATGRARGLHNASPTSALVADAHLHSSSGVRAATGAKSQRVRQSGALSPVRAHSVAAGRSSLFTAGRLGEGDVSPLVDGGSMAEGEHPSADQMQGSAVAGEGIEAAVRMPRVLGPVADEMPCLVLEGHTGGICATHYQPSWEALVSAGADNTIRLWSASVDQILEESLVDPESDASAHEGIVGAAAAAGSGNQLGTTPRTATPLVTFQLLDEGGEYGVESDTGGRGGRGRRQSTGRTTMWVAGNSDLVCGGGGSVSVVRLWDARAQALVHTLTGHTKPVTAINGTGSSSSSSSSTSSTSVAAGGSGGPSHSPLVVTGSADTTVRLWDMRARRPQVYTFRGHSDSVTGLVMGPHGGTVLSYSKDKTVRLWDLRAGRARHTFSRHYRAILDCVGCPELPAGGSAASAPVGMTPSTPVAASGTGMSLGIGGSPPAATTAGAGAMSASGGGSPGAGMAMGHGVPTPRTGVAGSDVQGPTTPGFITSGKDHNVFMWDFDGNCLGSLAGHRAAVYCVSPVTRRATAPNGSLTIRGDPSSGAAGGSPPSATTRRGAQRRQRQHPNPHRPDTPHVLTGSADGRVRMFNLSGSTKCVRGFQGHKGPVMHVNWAMSGTFAVSGSMDGTVKLWNMWSADRDLDGGAPDRCMKIFAGNAGGVTSMTMAGSSDRDAGGGRVGASDDVVFVGSRSGMIRVWGLRTSSSGSL